MVQLSAVLAQANILHVCLVEIYLITTLPRNYWSRLLNCGATDNELKINNEQEQVQEQEQAGRRVGFL